MKKIAIVTITHGENYGNRLQNYAMQEVYLKLKLNPLTINYEPIGKNKYKIIYNIKRLIKNILNFFTSRNELKRKINFKKFNNERINFSKKVYNEYNYKNININDFDVFSVGSDQVWNVGYGSFSLYYLLDFVKDKIKISYAASIGKNELNDSYKNIFKEKLKDFSKISLREDVGKKIIEEITNREDIKTLIDPTMLLEPKEWDKISTKPKQLKANKYILNYFIGELSEKRRNKINEFAKANHCEVINILDKNNPLYSIGPEEFLYLEKNAFFICTDSFHSCVFSILYNRPFLVFDREGTSVGAGSRLETLLNKFGLQDRKYNGKIEKKLLSYNYEKTYHILEIERKKSMEFIKEALDIKEK